MPEANEQWENRIAGDCVTDYAELISNCFELDEAFDVMTNEFEKFDDKAFYENISAFLHLKNAKTLDWLETQTERIKVVMGLFEFWTTCRKFTIQLAAL